MDNKEDGPWTTDVIRGNASNWSLQADAKLLEFMHGITKMVHERGVHITHNLHELILGLDKTKIALDNASNQLMALQHKQYVENRVYDDDEMLANIENVAIQNPSDAPIISAVSSALQNALVSGIKMVDKYFDKVSLDFSDSDDDDDVIRIVVIPKDLYKNRPLPFLIGSKEWYVKWHIGLAESDTDDAATLSDNDNKNEDLESWTPTHSMSTNMPTSLSESGSVTLQVSSQYRANRDISPYSSIENLSQVQHESSFGTANRMNKYELSLPPIDSRDFDTSNSIFAKQRPMNVAHVTATLIDTEPPALDEDQPIARKKPVNIFLEDESDSSDFNIFDDVQTKDGRPASETRSERQRNNPLNLFDDADYNSVMSGNSNTISSIIHRNTDGRMTNLFEDDSGDGLFASTANASPTIRSSIFSDAPSKKTALLYNLFDDEPPDENFQNLTSEPRVSSIPQKTDENQKSTGGAKAIRTISLFEERLSDDDLSIFRLSSKSILDASEDKSKSTTVADGSKLSSSSSTNENNSKKGTQLDVIDKSTEDDFYSSKSPSMSAIEVKWPTLIAEKPADGSSDLASRVPTQKIAAKKTKETCLFDVDNDDDDIFEKLLKAPKQAKAISKEPRTKPIKVVGTEGPWDSGDKEPFEVKPIKSNMSAAKPMNSYDAIRLFDDTPPDDDEDIFSSATQSQINQIPKPYNDFPRTFVEKGDEEPKQPTNKLSNVVSVDPENSSNVKVPETNKQQKNCDHKDFLRKVDYFVESVSNDEGEAEQSSARSLPKKLNMSNINIIVAALLPGAKQSTSAEFIGPSEGIASRASCAPDDTSDSIARSASQDNVDDSGRLVNLNRNRPKLCVARRPSTRRGRQQQYEKSLDGIEVIACIIDELNIPRPKLAETDFEIEKNEGIAQKQLSEESTVFDGSNLVGKVPPERRSDVLALDNCVKPKKAIVALVHPATNKSFLDPSIFDDVDMDDKDFDIFAGKLIKAKIPPTTKVTPAFIDDLPPDFNFINDSTFATGNDPSVSSIPNNTLDLFGADDEDGLDHDGIFTIHNAPAPQTSPKANSMTSNVFIDKSPPSLGPKQSMVIFEDSDSDGGNIFGSTTNKGVGPTAKTSTISPTIHTLTSRSTKLTAKPNTMHSNDGEKKIFGDDSSDDDLGLFSGDRKNKSALNQSKAETVKGRPKQMPSKKLFSDSDDDDLFSGSLKRLPAPTKRLLTQDTAKTLEPTASGGTSKNNPLSDLLK